MVCSRPYVYLPPNYSYQDICLYKRIHFSFWLTTTISSCAPESSHLSIIRSLAHYNGNSVPHALFSPEKQETTYLMRVHSLFKMCRMNLSGSSTKRTLSGTPLPNIRNGQRRKSESRVESSPASETWFVINNIGQVNSLKTGPPSVLFVRTWVAFIFA